MEEVVAKQVYSKWQDFCKVLKNDKFSVECTICADGSKDKFIKRTDFNTKQIHNHLWKFHQYKYVAIKKTNVSSGAKSQQQTIDLFFTQKMSLTDEIVAKLAADVGLTFNQIANPLIQKLIQAYTKVEAPKNVEKVRTVISGAAKFVKHKIRNEIVVMKRKGSKFTYVSDEATFKQLKVMNVHIFGSNNYSQNLGMIEMGKESDAKTLLKLQNQRLENFEIDPEKDCIGQTMDGAPVCTKCGRLSKRLHHVCYDHGIHNCVKRVTTRKKPKSSSTGVNYGNGSLCSSADENSDVEYLNMSDDEGSNGKTARPVSFRSTASSSNMTVADLCSDDSEFENNIEDINDALSDDEIKGEEFEYDPALTITETLKDVREAVKKFKFNLNLVKVLKENADTLKIDFKLLALDVSTRWNSSLKMITIFNDMMPAVKKTLVDYGHNWQDYLELSVPALIKILLPCKMAMDAISSDDSDLNMAEGALEFLLEEMRLQPESFLRDRLLQELEKEIEKRRPKLTVSLLKFLNNPGVLDETQEYPFMLAKKDEIIKEGIRIWKKHFYVSDDEDDDEYEVEEVPSETQSENVDAHDARSRLLESLKRRTTSNFVPKPPKRKRNFSKIVDPNDLTTEDFNGYILTGIKSEKLSKLENALKLLKPTSIRSEQNFSIAGNHRSKRRERMIGATLDDLSILKSYFQKEH